MTKSWNLVKTKYSRRIDRERAEGKWRIGVKLLQFTVYWCGKSSCMIDVWPNERNVQKQNAVCLFSVAGLVTTHKFNIVNYVTSSGLCVVVLSYVLVHFAFFFFAFLLKIPQMLSRMPFKSSLCTQSMLWRQTYLHYYGSVLEEEKNIL